MYDIVLSSISENLDVITRISILLAALYISMKAISIKRDSMLFTLQSNLSTAMKSYADMAAKKFDFVDDNYKKNKEKKQHYTKLVNQTKREILNQLEFACLMYINCKVDKVSFEGYFKDIIISWSKKTEKSKTIDSENVYKELKLVSEIFQGKEPIYTNKMFNFFRCISNCTLWTSIIFFLTVLVFNTIIFNLFSLQ